MKRLYVFFRDLSIGSKRNAILLVVLGGILASLFLMTGASINRLITDAGRRSVEQQAGVFLQGLDAQQKQVLQDARFLARTVGLIDVVAAGDAPSTRSTLLPVIAPLGFDSVLVSGRQAEVLASLGSSVGVQHSEQAQRLIRLGEIGVEITSILDDQDTAHLAAVVPLKNPAGAVIGTLLVTREMDAAFLDALDFGRADVHLVLIRDGVYVARDSAEAESDEHEVKPDTSLLSQALKGHMAVASGPTAESAGTPDFVAYAPVTIGGELWGAAQVSYEATELFALQDTFNRSMIISIIATDVLVILTLGLLTRRLIVNPVNQLRAAAQVIASGDYSKRIGMERKDEIGQLGHSFDIMAAAIQDRISEAQAAREQAEHSDRVKSAFLASMSHELRTPLNAVINFTKFVAKGSMGPVNDEQRSTLNEVIDSAKHLLNLINDVLDMSKIEAGSLKLFVEQSVDLEAILKTVVATAKSLVAEKPVELRTDIAPDLPKIVGDRQRILQVLLNIVGNAAKFTEAGHITIRAIHGPEEVVFSVEDTGPGIRPEDQPLVFTAFKQTDTGLRQGGGTGLGMPISKNLTEAHGGRLWMKSEPGSGTVFYVALPISAALDPTVVARIEVPA